MRIGRFGLYAVAALTVVGAATLAGAQGDDLDKITQRPVDIVLTMSNSRTYEGQYHATGLSRYCGTMTLGQPQRVKSFSVEFPYEGEYVISDLSFDAETLPSGGTTTSYYVSVSLTTSNGGKPAAFVLRTRQPQFNERGTASLTVTGETARLKINGMDDRGQTLNMTVVCGPKRKP